MQHKLSSFLYTAFYMQQLLGYSGWIEAFSGLTKLYQHIRQVWQLVSVEPVGVYQYVIHCGKISFLIRFGRIQSLMKSTVLVCSPRLEICISTE
ncbi:MAG: hypothetical protein HQM10_04690 [Candidatus Riflebacteria bacterium]|nr:hypothetical protein [Candidatus Riflebacteria bacterium]